MVPVEFGLDFIEYARGDDFEKYVFERCSRQPSARGPDNSSEPPHREPRMRVAIGEQPTQRWIEASGWDCRLLLLQACGEGVHGARLGPKSIAAAALAKSSMEEGT